MTPIQPPRPSSTTCPTPAGDHYNVLPVEQLQFSSIFEQQTQQSAQNTAGMYAAATDSGADEQKRRHNYIPGKLFDTLTENTVNSPRIPSEKCHDSASQNFADEETTKQQYRGNSSDTQSNNQKKNHASSKNTELNLRNHTTIDHCAMAQPPTNTGIGMAPEAILALPAREMKKLVRVLRNTSLSKRASVFLTLDLQELGEVKLDVTLKAKKVFITAHVANRRAAAALSFALTELRKQLATIDLTLEHFEVSTGRRPTGNVKENTAVGATVAIN